MFSMLMIAAIVALVLFLVNTHRPCGTTYMVMEPIRQTGDVLSLRLLSNQHCITDINETIGTFAIEGIIKTRELTF